MSAIKAFGAKAGAFGKMNLITNIYTWKIPNLPRNKGDGARRTVC